MRLLPWLSLLAAQAAWGASFAGIDGCGTYSAQGIFEYVGQGDRAALRIDPKTSSERTIALSLPPGRASRRWEAYAGLPVQARIDVRRIPDAQPGRRGPLRASLLRIDFVLPHAGQARASLTRVGPRPCAER